jgi:glucokinase
MLEALRREATPIAVNACRIVPALLGERIGDYAALSLAVSAAG